MGNEIIGSTYPVGEEFAPNEEEGRTLQVALQEIIDWHNERLAPVLAGYPDTADIDTLLILGEDNVVIDYKVIRVKDSAIDDDPKYTGVIFGDVETIKTAKWLKSIVDYAHSVEGMETFWILHRHPNFNPNPSQYDDRTAHTLAAIDFLTTGGNAGGPRHFQDISVYTVTTSMPCDANPDQSTVMEIDVLLAEAAADAYEVAFGIDHDIATTQRAIADSVRDLYEESSENGSVPNPMRQLQYRFEVELPNKMKQGAAMLEMGFETFKEKLEAGYAKMSETGQLVDRYIECDAMTEPEPTDEEIAERFEERNKRGIGFGSPEDIARQIIQHLEAGKGDSLFEEDEAIVFESAPSEDIEEEDEEEPTLHPGILADLGGFDFSQLDT